MPELTEEQIDTLVEYGVNVGLIVLNRNCNGEPEVVMADKKSAGKVLNKMRFCVKCKKYIDAKLVNKHTHICSNHVQ